jgi:hypothetical protein
MCISNASAKINNVEIGIWTMTELSIQEHLIELGIAQNVFQATHIANGLKLYELKTVEEQVARARLYREWRWAGEKTKASYEHAIRGDKAPERLITEGEGV